MTAEPPRPPCSYGNRVPDDVTARHRAGGVGRLLAIRTAAPRHAARPEQPADAATIEIRAVRPRRRGRLLAVLAVPILAAATPLAFRESGTPRAAVPLPVVSLPRPPAVSEPPAPATTRRSLQAVRQAAKISPVPSSASASAPASAPASTGVPRVLLGPATDADVGPLLGSYCRATYGRFSIAAATADGWACARLGRATVAVDLNAMCRWRYGDRARAEPGRAGDPGSWRCYRDGP